MRQQPRGIKVWLGVLGAIIAVTALANIATAPLMSLLLAGGYIALLTALFASDRLRQLQQAIPTLAVTARVSPAARAATSRARRLANASTPEVVTDVGIIVNEKDRNGRLRPKSITPVVSLGDEAIQPYVKLEVPVALSQRTAVVRFEVIDRAGKVQFSREVEQYVRDGDNLIASDRQLPLRDNDKLGRPGTWDLQVSVNGTLAAIHSFNVTPVPAAPVPARARLADDGEAPLTHNLSAPDEEEESKPLSLEDLLREQRQGKS